MTTNREIIDSRIFNFLKHQLSPHYNVINVRTCWIGQRNGEKFFSVRYFVTSDRFIGGVRFETVSVREKEVRYYEDE